MLKSISLLFLFFACFGFSVIAQRGKNGSYTVTAANTQLNAYTAVTANAAVNATSITVASNALTNAVLSTNLAAGDLIMIIQMQGATMDIDPIPATPVALGGWGGTYTVPIGHQGDWGTTQDLWGQVTSYNNAGKYELVEVRSVSGGTTINLMCGLVNAYTASGHVQVVRVPRFTNLTINAGMTVVPALWDGTIGGVLSLEVNGTLTLNATSKVLATGYGFRGGVCDLQTAGSPPGSAASVGYCASSAAIEGAEKGEGIGGFYAEYDALYSRYCKSAPANAGGGGGNHNAGGGGGSNIGTGAYTGKGNPVAGYTTAWNLESASFSTSTSSGGGRGGYSYSTNNQNETTVGPNNTLWSGDYRRNEGGLGGHPLTYSASRLFMGGGGGAGDANANPTQGGAGGRGGGIIFLTVYGSITGTGTIESNGAVGQNANPLGLVAPAASATRYGNDGAGGAGGGGAIAISNGTAIPAAVTLSATGGAGGNQVISFGGFVASPTMEADGPGGGGAGGMIAFTSGTPVQTVAGGINGTTNSSHVTLFQPNGATMGAAGTASLPQTFFDITSPNVTICPNTSTTLTATVIGTLPGGSLTWYSTQFGATVLGTGTTFTTPVLSATTTYYVGTCPGTFRVPVIVTISPALTISGTATITNVSCLTGGSITGLTVAGGTNPLTITWNGVVTPTMNLTNAAAGNYTVLVTDASGCTATSGPYTINSSSGPVINTTNLVLTNANCLGNNGSITGITATGSGLTYLWTNGPVTLDNTGLGAGSYSLTVTDNLGCTATVGPYAITQTSGPTVNTVNMVITDATCGNPTGSITGITSTGTGLTYQWNGAANPNEDLATIAAGNYTLVVTDNIGCTATTGVIVVGNIAGPTLNQANVVLVDEHCNSADGSISGIQINGGTLPYTISWNAGAYSTLDLANIIAGNYSLVVTDFNGCSVNAGPFAIQSIAGPTINDAGILITDESCLGNDGSITGITASGTTLTYDWNGTASPSIDLTNASAGAYTLTVTDAFGCTASSGPYTISGAVVLSLDATNVVITPSSCTVNDGQINGLVVVGGINPTISWSNTDITADIVNLAPGLYTITITDAQNCTLTADYTVGTALGPVIDNVVTTNATCVQANGGIAITASGGTGILSYSIDNGITTGGINTFANLPAGSYDIIVEDQGGCQATSTIVLTDTPLPSIDNLALVDPSCGNTDGSISITASNGTGALSYSIDGGTSFVGTTLFNNLGAGNYTVVVNDNLGCSSQQVVQLTNQGGPVVNAGIDQVVCQGDQVTLTGSGAQAYAWSNGVTNAVPFTPVGTTTYTVTGTDAFGCTGTDQVTVTVNAQLVISVTPSITSGCVPLTVTFVNTTPNSGDCIWQFSNGYTGSNTISETVTFNQSGCYDLTLSVVSTTGCTGTQLFDDIICIDPSPIASFSPSPAIMTTLDPTSEMINHSLSATNYLWDFGDGTGTSTANSPTHTFPSDVAGNYVVTLVAFNSVGCFDSAQVIVTVNEELIYYVPNAFTPSGDEFNEVFHPIFTSGFDPADYNIQIFDRWGEVVFDTDDHLVGWDGTHRGQKAKDGVYTYRIEFKRIENDERIIVHGSVTLLR